ncbi:MAG TPA: hypothetical protein VHZ03_44075 [Trebonia sp.]|nr:hypothetical protein [Trebonia sp.]
MSTAAHGGAAAEPDPIISGPGVLTTETASLRMCGRCSSTVPTGT